MRKIILSLLVFCFSLLFTLEAIADNHRLWTEHVEDDGGELKTWMVDENLADESGFTCGALLHVAWKKAEERGIAQEVGFPAAKLKFTKLLADWFFSTNNLPCENFETKLSWVMFGEIGRGQNGYYPFTPEVVQQSIATAEADAKAVLHAQAKVEQVEARDKGLVYHVPGVYPEADTNSAVSAEESDLETDEVPFSDFETSETVSTSVNHSLPRVRGSQYVGDLDVSPRRLPSQAEKQAFHDAAVQAEREEAKAKKRKADARLEKQKLAEERQAEIDRLRYESIVRGLNKGLETRSKKFRVKNEVALQSHHVKSVIEKYFSDIPEMVKIAECETVGFSNVQSDLKYPKGKHKGKRERSFGPFQIHELAWHEDAIQLGLTDYKTDIMQNMIMARHVYERQGWQAWENCAIKKGLL